MFTLYTYSHSDTSNKVPDHTLCWTWQCHLQAYDFPISTKGFKLNLACAACLSLFNKSLIHSPSSLSEFSQDCSSHGNISGKCSLCHKALKKNLCWDLLLIADSRKGQYMSCHQGAKTLLWINKTKYNKRFIPKRIWTGELAADSSREQQTSTHSCYRNHKQLHTTLNIRTPILNASHDFNQTYIQICKLFFKPGSWSAYLNIRKVLINF